jgi:hypothetical protein
MKIALVARDSEPPACLLIALSFFPHISQPHFHTTRTHTNGQEKRPGANYRHYAIFRTTIYGLCFSQRDRFSLHRPAHPDWPRLSIYCLDQRTEQDRRLFRRADSRLSRGGGSTLNGGR